MSDMYVNENDSIPCRLRVKGTFFLRCGVKQVCMMLSETINITFGDELVFNCRDCPDPVKRDELLEFYKNQPDCALCKKNMATKEVPKDVVLLPGDPPVKAGTQLCISCYAGAEYQYQQERYMAWKVQYDKMKQEYEDGKITYSELVDFKKKFEEDNPGVIIQ